MALWDLSLRCAELQRGIFRRWLYPRCNWLQDARVVRVEDSTPVRRGCLKRGWQEKPNGRKKAFSYRSTKTRQRAFLAAIGARGFFGGDLSHQFHCQNHPLTVAPDHRKGAGNQPRPG